MKTRKPLAAIASIALIGILCLTTIAYAANNEKRTFVKERPAISNIQKQQRAELADSQKADMQEQMKARLAQDLADGRITQEQYDEMITAFENGQMPMFGGMQGKAFSGERPEFNDKMPELSAEQKAEMLEQGKARLAQDLADGRITQEQYDEMITAFENGQMPMFGGMRGKVFSGERPEFNDKMPELSAEQKAEMQARMNNQGRGGMGFPNRMGNRPNQNTSANVSST